MNGPLWLTDLMRQLTSLFTTCYSQLTYDDWILIHFCYSNELWFNYHWRLNMWTGEHWRDVGVVHASMPRVHLSQLPGSSKMAGTSSSWCPVVSIQRRLAAHETRIPGTGRRVDRSPAPHLSSVTISRKFQFTLFFLFEIIGRSLVSTQNIPENFISLGQFALKLNQFYSNLITNWPIYKFQFITGCYRRGLLNEPVYSLRKSFDQLGRCRPFVDWWRGQWPRSSLTAGGNKFTCCRVCLI